MSMIKNTIYIVHVYIPMWCLWMFPFYISYYIPTISCMFVNFEYINKGFLFIIEDINVVCGYFFESRNNEIK